MSDEFRIAFALFPGVTQLDFTGPHQVFSRWPGASVRVASAAGGSVAADGLTFSNLARLRDLESCDLLCVPGGGGVTEAILDDEFVREIARLARGARYVTSVCTGSIALAAAGLLTGRRAGCHWAWRDLLEPFGVVVDEGRVVRDGRFITGGGITAGIDLALAVVAEVSGPLVAQSVQLVLEYAPEPPFDSGRPERAPAEVRELVLERTRAFQAPRRAAVLAAASRLASGAPAPLDPEEARAAERLGAGGDEHVLLHGGVLGERVDVA